MSGISAIHDLCLNIVEPCRFMLNLRRGGRFVVDGGNRRELVGSCGTSSV